jgi:hypothetical protein
MKSKHPTGEELLRFRRGLGGAAELHAVEAHLFACASCRELAGGDVRQSVAAMWADETEAAENDHLSFELMEAVVDGRADETERELADAHTAICEMCTGELRALERVRAEVEGERRGGAWRFVVPAVAAAAVVAFFLLPGKPVVEPPPRVAPKVTTAPQRELLFVDRTGPVYRDAAGRLIGVPAAWEPLLRDGLQGKRAPAVDLTELQGEHDALRGAEAQSGIELLQPAGVIASDARPLFTWRRHGNDRPVRVAVYDEQFRLVAQSEPLTTSRWIPDAPLRRGEMYQWQLTIISGDETIKVPRPPVSPPRFRVLDRKTHDEIVRARAEGGHAAAFVLLIRAGLLDDAKRELQSLRALNPRSDSVDALESHQPAPATTNAAQ